MLVYEPAINCNRLQGLNAMHDLELEKQASKLIHLLSKFSIELCNSIKSGGVTMADIEKLNLLQKELNDFIEKEAAPPLSIYEYKEDQYCEISGAKLDRPRSSQNT